MTAAELIEKLKEFPPDTPVFLGIFYFGGPRGSYNCEAIGRAETVEAYVHSRSDRVKETGVKIYADRE